LLIPPTPGGFGSSANGRELLFLVLATCYCNDLYHEAAKRSIDIDRLQVEVSEAIDLMRFTDTVAEVQKRVRSSSAVTLAECKAGRASRGEFARAF
jgi:hypothetical protein